MKIRPKRYKIERDAVGMTPRQRLDTRRAELAELELRKKRGELLDRSEVEHERRETAEILRSDLGALAAKQAMLVAGKKLTVPQARTLLHGAIVVMTERWVEAGKVEKTQGGTSDE